MFKIVLVIASMVILEQIARQLQLLQHAQLEQMGFLVKIMEEHKEFREAVHVFV
jgi:hypothetical protein